MLTQIAKFEIRYLLRNPLVWTTAAVVFTVFFFAMNVKEFEMGSEGGLVANAAYATVQNYLILSILFMFGSTSFVANAVIRDDETGFGPIIRSTQITKFDYVIGRFLGAFAVTAILIALIAPATWLGSLMPWAPAGTIGPNRITDHLYGLFLIALPNVLVHSAIFFALATITRSMMATYLGVIGFAAAFFTLEGALRRPQIESAVSIAEPFAYRALADATRYWTIPERNTLLPEFTGPLLYNRLLWITVAMLFLAVAYAVFRVGEKATTKRKEISPASREGSRGVAERLPDAEHGGAALRALLWMRTRFEVKQVMKSPAFPVLMAWGLYTSIFVLLTKRDPAWRPTYPTTLKMIPAIEDAFRVIPLVIAIYYAGELVWRERDRRVHELIDASPLPNWAYVVPKTVAMALLFLCIFLINVAASVGVQLGLGFTDLELGKYMLWYVLPATFDALLLAGLAIFVQALSPHKAVGWGVMTLFLAWLEMNKSIKHNLLKFGGKSQVPLSDLNGISSFWSGAWTFRLYWGAFVILLLVAAHLLWRRGTDVRLEPRLRLARVRLEGSAGWVAAAALLTFVASGAYAYYNTNVLNEYRTSSAVGEEMAEYERRFWKYHTVPQPSLEELILDVDLHPKARRAVVNGRYVLRNRTSQPVTELHVRIVGDGELELVKAAIDTGRLTLDDKRFGYQIYSLDRPIQPGEARALTFQARRQIRGFRNSQQSTGMVANGSFLRNSDLMPLIGMTRAGLHHDPGMRKKYGLPGTMETPALEDVAVTMTESFVHGWMRKSDITLTTDADQTPVAPGKRVSDVTRNGRRTARFVTTAPTRVRFAVQSARYAEKRRKHNGVELEVYYHPRHHWNVDRMLDAAAASLDYYQANFGPYQFDHFRIVEFPAYADFAQAFAGTIPFSESVGFIADHTKPDTLDNVTGVTAHEFAHQWWPNQMIAAEMEGQIFFVETLAQYSAHMVMKKLRGEDHIRRYLQFELDRYLIGRAYSKEEPVLARVMGEDHIAYRKGSVAMYLLQKRLGEDAVNRALRNMLARNKFKSAPYPRTVDLIAAFRAEAKSAEDQELISDLFERITLYDMKVVEPKAVQRADGRWDVSVPVEARKVYASAEGEERETPLSERIEIGLFAAEPGRDAFNQSNVILMERHPIRSGSQVIRFVTDRKPSHAGVDPYNYYVDRNSADNVAKLSS